MGADTKVHERIFTAGELRILATHPGDLAAAALKRGDVEETRKICAQSIDMHRDLFENYCLWNTKNLSWVVSEYGLESFHAMVRESLPPWLRPVVETFRNGATREAIAGVAQIWRMACTRFGPADEDDGRIVIALDGAGEFFRIDQRGAPYQPMSEALTLGSLHSYGGQDPDVPLMAAAILHAEALMIEWLGYPPFVIDFRPDGTPERLTIHKRPLDVPLVYFDRVGKVRDARLVGGAVDVAGGRLFGGDELIGMTRQAVSRAFEALDVGDLGRAMGWCHLSKGEWYPTHHILRDWVTAQLGWLYERHGVDALYEAIQRGHTEPAMEPMLKVAEQMDLRAQVEALAAGFRQHAMRFRIEEDAEKFIFATEPCGSGGRLIQEGAYSSPKNLPRIRERHEASFFLEDLPLYCAHCPSTNRQILSRGGPYFLLVDGDLMNIPDGNCNFYVFKDAKAVPDRFFRRSGLDRSGCPACHGPGS